MTKKRSSYKDELKWNVNDLYNSIEDYELEYKNLEKDLEKYQEYKGHILDNFKTLYDLLEFDTSYSKRLERIYIYAHIQNDQDTTDTYYQSLFGKVYKLFEKKIMI